MEWLSPDLFFSRRDIILHCELSANCEIRGIKNQQDESGHTNFDAPQTLHYKYEYINWIKESRPSLGEPYRPTLALAMHRGLGETFGDGRMPNGTFLPYDVDTFRDAGEQLFQYSSFGFTSKRTTALFHQRRVVSDEYFGPSIGMLTLKSNGNVVSFSWTTSQDSII